MSKLNQCAIFFGLGVPLFILSASFDLSEFTIAVWPTMIGLMALGGKISGVGDYFYIGFTILLNALIYLLAFNLTWFIYQKLCKKAP